MRKKAILYLILLVTLLSTVFAMNQNNNTGNTIKPQGCCGVVVGNDKK